MFELKPCMYALLFVFTATGTATAQQVQQQSPNEQAIGNKLMQEIGNGLQCQSALITAQRELEELKKKHDAPPQPPAK